LPYIYGYQWLSKSGLIGDERELTRPGPASLRPDEPVAPSPRPIAKGEVQMAGFLQYIGLAFGFAVIGLGLAGFFRGLSLPPNSPEHRAHGKGDSWRT
jgi:hypothetical protein